MKKKNLKNLSVKKSTISSLNQQSISGGTIQITIILRTLPPATVTGCSLLMACDSVELCPPADACKVKPIDTATPVR